MQVNVAPVPADTEKVEISFEQCNKEDKEIREMTSLKGVILMVF